MSYVEDSTKRLRTEVGRALGPGLELFAINQSPTARERLSRWVRVLVNTVTASYASIGPRETRLRRAIGNVTVQIFTLVKDGDLASLQLADRLISKLDGEEYAEEGFKIRLNLPFVSFSGADAANEKLWFQTNVTIPYSIDYTTTD